MKIIDITEATESYEEIASTLVKDCKVFFNQVKNTIDLETQGLYRGVRYNSRPNGESWQVVHTRQIRTDRTPLDTTPKIQKEFDAAFTKYHGHPWRSSSIFCTGSPTKAGSYGSIRLVFPKGQFEFLWSPEVDDLYDEYKLSKDSPEEFIRYAEYQNTDLPDAIDSLNEIMVRGNEYYVVRVDKYRKNIWPVLKRMI